MGYLDSNYSEILTVAELADELGVGKTRAYDLVTTGKIKAFRLGRIWKIPRASVIEFICDSTGLKK